MITPQIRTAKKSEAYTILNLYKSVIGQEGCTWNDLYPNMIEIQNDLNSNNLYVCVLDNKIIGAASIVSENELDDINLWKICDGRHKELARLVISPDYQRKGYSKYFLQYLLTKLNENKIPAVHLLVAINNYSAINLYKQFNFKCVGQLYI